MTSKTVGAFEAKTHFSALIEAAERGETIVVTKKGKPVAQIGPIAEGKPPLTPREAMKGLFSIRASIGKSMNVRELIEEGRRV
jgi:prevent-host-death family protein